MNTTLHWNVIYTRRNCEEKVSILLKKKGIVHFFPQNQVILKGFKSKKIIISSLFPSIIFVQATDKGQLKSLVQMRNVVNVVYWQQEPAILPAGEMNLLRNFLEAHENIQVIKKDLRIDTREMPVIQYSPEDKIYSIDLPSIGYSLSAKDEIITNVQLVRKTGAGYAAVNSLAFMLGFKNGNNKFD